MTELQDRLEKVESNFKQVNEQIAKLQDASQQLVGQATILRELLDDEAQAEEGSPEDQEASVGESVPQD